MAFVVKALVEGLRAFPRFNASLDASGQTLVLKKYFHVGIAVDTPAGLLVAVIRDCDKKSVVQIADEIADVSTRAREIGLRVALGAQRRDVISLVTRQTMLLAVIGLAGGVALAWFVARSLRAMLAGVAPADATTFVVAAATCLVMMAIGSVLPIRRALRLDPVRLIRTD